MTARSVLALRVEGMVQGVGFRWFVRERAATLGLVGWVWNAPDGAVELCAAGEAASLSLLRAEIEGGPQGAAVERVLVLAPDPTAADREGFAIVRGPERPAGLRSGRRPDCDSRERP